MTQLPNLGHATRITRCNIKVYTYIHSVDVLRTFLKKEKKKISYLLPMQHSPTGFSNGRTLCALRGAQCTFGYNVHNSKLEVLTEVFIKSQIFYDVRPC